MMILVLHIFSFVVILELQITCGKTNLPNDQAQVRLTTIADVLLPLLTKRLIYAMKSYPSHSFNF